MPPKVHIVRHAEGFHNCSKGGEGIHDPFLTEKGQEQCRELCSQFSEHDKIDLLMASPMKRTIQTCQTSFAPVVARGHKILLMPLAQESSNEPMDTGSSEEQLKDTFGDLIDTSRLELFPYWHSNKGQFDTDGVSQIERALHLRNVLKGRPEKNIVLVTHGSFAHFVAGNVNAEGKQMTRMWSNAKCRTYKFADDDVHGDARLVELQESIDRRPDLEKEGDAFVWSLDSVKRGSAGNIHATAGVVEAVKS
ncbi:hypothetical protein CLAFUW4_08615 [Fulvia fulva]|uniref:Phosphoglycerate mutase-like protein n=1 Tax=Passalora fulva TaxID=5499 RepID=A0A9Q8P6F9_PASFU|nr:uncharacterized protein CLAFUR5_08716 [Fulvia fulva]KAK4630452.1 hypothetical protein CLAFUR0_08613 [Fulvia fulva]UJO14954.1 hypothetical protein CLAFUR5_08716 [Fulvia fulva]WPV12470.1 hypothetical protein CLAFUW4_08615 [Fulvia fulva]